MAFHLMSKLRIGTPHWRLAEWLIVGSSLTTTYVCEFVNVVDMAAANLAGQSSERHGPFTR